MEGFEELRLTVLRHLGVDLASYHRHQLERRLAYFLLRHRLGDLRELARRMEGDYQLRSAFRDFLTINVSEFFRNPERFQELETRVLPLLLRERSPLRIWSAGCANGAEIYSVALLLEELSPGGNHVLLATDIDEESLRKAREAVYSNQEVRSLPSRFTRYFSRSGDRWSLSRKIVEKVTFLYHNLLSDPPFEDCDLILCRNVIIYFSDQGKEIVFRSLSRGLRPGGYLFIGGTEVVLHPARYSLGYISPCFYRKEVEVGEETSGGRAPARGFVGSARV